MIKDTITFIVPAERKRGVNIYKPQVFSKARVGGIDHDFPPRYQVPAYVNELPPDLASKLIVNYGSPRFPDDPCAQAKSNYPPRIGHPDIDWLVKALQQMDARNIPRDEIFKHVALRAWADVIELPDFAKERWPNASLTLILRHVEVIRA